MQIIPNGSVYLTPLTKGNSSIWIRNFPEINIYDKSNNVIAIRSKSDEGFFVPSPIDFTAVVTQDYEVHDLEYFIGCDNIEIYWRRYLSDRKTNFDKGFFDTVSNECIDVGNNEKIHISLELSNNNVIVSPKERNKNDDVYPQFPTAIGEIKSNVLEISILPN